MRGQYAHFYALLPHTFSLHFLPLDPMLRSTRLTTADHFRLELSHLLQQAVTEPAEQFAPFSCFPILWGKCTETTSRPDVFDVWLFL